MSDWTIDHVGRSATFIALSDAVERIIRNSAHDLIAGRADAVACSIVDQLAHVYGVAPLPKPKRVEPWQRWCKVVDGQATYYDIYTTSKSTGALSAAALVALLQPGTYATWWICPLLMGVYFGALAWLAREATS